MQRSILIQALSSCPATESLVPGRAPPTPPRPMDPNTLIMEDSVLYNITIDDLNIHEIFEHSLATMIRNRRDLIKEIFSILAPHEIKTMLPTPISAMKPKEVMKLCYMQLKEMPEAHLVAILTHLANPQQATITYYKPSNLKSKTSKKSATVTKLPSRSPSPAPKIKNSPQTNISNKSPYRSTEYFTTSRSPIKKRRIQSKSNYSPEKSLKQHPSSQYWDTSFDYSPQNNFDTPQETSYQHIGRSRRSSSTKRCSSPITGTNYSPKHYASISKDRYDDTGSYRRSRSSSANSNDPTPAQEKLSKYYCSYSKTSTAANKHSTKVSIGSKKSSATVSKYSPTYRQHTSKSAPQQKLSSHKPLSSSVSSNIKLHTSLDSRKGSTNDTKKHKKSSPKAFSTHRDFTPPPPNTITSNISSNRHRLSPKKRSYNEKKSLSFDNSEREAKNKDKDNRKRLSSAIVSTSREYDQNKKSKKK